MLRYLKWPSYYHHIIVMKLSHGIQICTMYYDILWLNSGHYYSESKKTLDNLVIVVKYPNHRLDYYYYFYLLLLFLSR